MPSIWEAIFGPKSIPVQAVFSRILDIQADAFNRMRAVQRSAQDYREARTRAQRTIGSMRPGRERAEWRMRLDAIHSDLKPSLENMAAYAADLDTIKRAIMAAQQGNRTFTLTPDGDDIIIEGMHFTGLTAEQVAEYERGVGGLTIILSAIGVVLAAIAMLIYNDNDKFKYATKTVDSFNREANMQRITMDLPPELMDAPDPGGLGFSTGTGLALMAPVVAALVGGWFLFGRRGR